MHILSLHQTNRGGRKKSAFGVRVSAWVCDEGMPVYNWLSLLYLEPERHNITLHFTLIARVGKIKCRQYAFFFRMIISLARALSLLLSIIWAETHFGCAVRCGVRILGLYFIHKSIWLRPQLVFLFFLLLSSRLRMCVESSLLSAYEMIMRTENEKSFIF